ncbi:uncharacterized protein [Anoplolepis gracilipes]|uniref:uncharacterized protein n=1 Tax=Anoplolepis gracilipes TaxID=354296 RepID=UPI003BA26596
MQRVLTISYQIFHNIGGSSKSVTKQLCFSTLLWIGVVCLLCGFLVGRSAIKMSTKTQAQNISDELAGNGLQATEHLQQMALIELTKTSFDYVTNWQMPYSKEKKRYINEVFSNLSFIHEVENDTSFIRATVHGLQEPDIYVILSVNGDGIAVALELAQVLDRIYSTHNWRPRRTLIFCISLTSTDVCSRIFPLFLLEKVMAYIAVHGRFTQANNRVTLTGSDVIRSIAVEAIKTIPNRNWTYLENELFGPRLSLNVPHVIFSFDNNSANNQIHHNENLQSRRLTLAQMVSKTIWRLSESIVIHWEPNYFNYTVNKVFELFNSKYRKTIEILKKNVNNLLAAVKDFNAKFDTMNNTNKLILPVRVWNDLFLDLDKALLCFSKIGELSVTDLTNLCEKLNYQPRLYKFNEVIFHLEKIGDCYLNAIKMLNEEEILEEKKR